MGAGSSSDNRSSSELRPVHVADTDDSYPEPRPTIQRKSELFKEADYAHVDSHAKSAPSSVCSDYSSLLDYLFEDLKTDLQMVRAIFTWVGSQNIAQMRLSHVKDSETPAGYMRLIQKEQGSYAAFFTQLCRAAKIPCVIVRGTGKAVGYEAGDENISDMKSKWTSVYVAGQWRLVHPLWAFNGVKGQKSGKWTLIEKKGEGQREKERQYKGSDVCTTDEFFFLTDPDQFIFFCRANADPWQLLKEPLNQEQFTKAPFVTPEYFSSSLKLISHDSCDLVANEGKEAVRFEHNKDRNPSLSYELYCDEEGSNEKLPDNIDLERYVLENTQKTTKALFLRFPVAGIYKLRVFGGESQNPPHLCDFRIRVDERAKNPNPFPLQKDIGYGYGQDAKDAGLVTTSAYSGIVVLDHGQKMTFNFDVDRPVQFETKLHHRDKTTDELEKYVEKEVSNKNAEITVTMPDKGLTKDSEYALEINTKEEGKDEPYKNVCNYFLTPDKNWWKDDSDAQPNNKAVVKPVGRGRDPVKGPPPKKRSESPRDRMRTATGGDSIDDLERTINDFERSDLKERDEDHTRAKERLIQLRNAANKDETPRRRMREATKGDSIEELEKSIEDFENSDLEERDYDLTEAKRRLEELKRKEAEKDKIRQKMRDETYGDDIEELEKSIDDFENAGIDERNNDLTEAKRRLQDLKNKQAEKERPRDVMREATKHGGKDELEKAIKDFEESGLDEKDEDYTKAKERLAELQAKEDNLNPDEEERLRRKLQDALDGDDLDELEKALGACKDAGLSDKGDISEAERRLMQMHKDKLEEARKERDAEKLQNAIEEAEQSVVANKLDDTQDFQEAKETHEQLTRVRRINQKVLDLNPRLVSEIASYKRPKPCIKDVMRATYLVLGEEDAEDNWQKIVKNMKSIGQNNILRRVGQFDIVGVDTKKASKAHKLIFKYDLNDVQRNSRGAGTFYTWTRNVTTEVLGKGSDD